jgi:hypothetical protein
VGIEDLDRIAEVRRPSLPPRPARLLRDRHGKLSWTPEAFAWAREAREAGLSYLDIANSIGATRKAVESKLTHAARGVSR